MARRRHKKIAYYNGDWNLFNILRRKGYVVKQYYYTKPDTLAGEVYLTKETGEEFVSVAVAEVKRVDYQAGKKRKYAYYRKMYQLTTEGWQFLKGVLMEENI